MPAAHAAITCDAAPPARITVETVPPHPTVDTSLDMAALARRARSDMPHDGTTRHAGLTTGRLVGSFIETIDFARQPGAPAPTICGAARSVAVRVGFEEAAIFVAREITQDRCLHDQVLAHENRHVAVDRALLTWVAPRLETAVRTALGQLGIARAPTQEAVWATIRRRIESAVDAEMRALQQERRKRQQLVDRPEEYRRFAESCGGALGRLLAR
jgi:hypothetical protein